MISQESLEKIKGINNCRNKSLEKGNEAEDE